VFFQKGDIIVADRYEAAVKALVKKMPREIRAG